MKKFKKQIPFFQKIRPTEKINEEYSRILFNIGQVDVELHAIDHARAQQDARVAELEDKKVEYLERVKELSDEAIEADKKTKQDNEKLRKIPADIAKQNEAAMSNPEVAS